MNGKGTLVLSMVGVGVGTALMYWFDPSAGKRRRSHARYQTKRAVRRAQRIIDDTQQSIDKMKRMGWADVGKVLIPVTMKAILWR